MAEDKRFVTGDALKAYHELVKTKLQALLTTLLSEVNDAAITITSNGEQFTGNSFSVNQAGAQTINLPAATTAVSGVVKIGTDIAVSSGVISVDKATSVTQNNTKPVTSGAVYSAIQDAVTSVIDYKGTIGTGGTVTALPTSGIKKGMAYRVATAGTYAGQVCEVGDIIIAIGTTNANSSWTVIQNNIDLSGVASSIKIGANGSAITPTNGTITLPEYPTVHNGVLTMLIAGVLAQTFSADASLPATFNVPDASTTAYGVVKVAGTNTASVATTPGTTSNRYYGVGKDKDGKLYVNVPWENNTYTVNNGTLTLQIAGTNKATFTANQASAATFNVPEATTTTLGVAKQYDATEVTSTNYSFD